MTVQALIRKLSEFPPHLRVVTPGVDEGGLDDLETVEQISVRFEYPVVRPLHFGTHRKDDSGEPAVLLNF